MWLERCVGAQDGGAISVISVRHVVQSYLVASSCRAIGFDGYFAHSGTLQHRKL